jgi:hypothetical protein
MPVHHVINQEIHFKGLISLANSYDKKERLNNVRIVFSHNFGGSYFAFNKIVQREESVKIDNKKKTSRNTRKACNKYMYLIEQL